MSSFWVLKASRRQSSSHATADPAPKETTQTHPASLRTVEPGIMAPRFKVLIPVFPGFNTLDLNGPAEVVGNSAIAPTETFATTIASATEATSAFENITVGRNVSFVELLSNNAAELLKFDILIIPGGPGADVQAAIDSGGDGLLDLVEVFATQKADEHRPKWLVSICTGAGFLAVRGLLGGKTVTGHWAYVDRLQDMCNEASKIYKTESTTVVRKRWVDTGLTKSGIRLVTAGGVSCGIDCTLWMVSELAGIELASKVAMAMDYDWKYSNIPVTTGQIL